VLGIVATKGKKVAAGLDLYPVGKTGAFLVYRCGARATTTLDGSAIVPTSTQIGFTEMPITFSQTNGRQEPESFQGEARDVLTNDTGEQTGLSGEMTLAVEEPMEINGLF